MWKLALVVLAAVCAVGLGGMMTGGLRDLDPSDEGARNALSFAVAEHNRKSNEMYLNDVAEVVKVQRQLVSGFKYIITAKLLRTTCKKGAMDTACPLQVSTVAPPRQCVFTVWTQPWMNSISLISEECT